MDPPEIKELGEEEFGFKSAVKNVFPSIKNENITAPLSLVSSSYRYGLLFIGLKKELKVFAINDLIDGEGSGHICLLSLPGYITHVAVNCDQFILLVTTVINGRPYAFFFDVCSILQKGMKSCFYSVPLTALSECTVESVAWNPTDPNLITVSINTGELALLQLKEKSVQFTKVDIKASALCWSPKGKQLSVGTLDGTMVLFKPDLSLVRKINAPTIEGIGSVTNIVWFKTIEFLVTYRRNGNFPCICHVSAPKDRAPTFVNMEDICYSSDQSNRPMSYYSLFIPEWALYFALSSHGVEMGMLGTNTLGDCWYPWVPEEGRRASMNFVNVVEETFPLGLCIALTSQKTFTEKETKKGPFPALLSLSTGGQLNIFFMENNLTGEPLIQSLQQFPAPSMRTPEQFNYVYVERNEQTACDLSTSTVSNAPHLTSTPIRPVAVPAQPIQSALFKSFTSPVVQPAQAQSLTAPTLVKSLNSPTTPAQSIQLPTSIKSSTFGLSQPSATGQTSVFNVPASTGSSATSTTGQTSVFGLSTGSQFASTSIAGQTSVFNVPAVPGSSQSSATSASGQTSLFKPQAVASPGAPPQYGFGATAGNALKIGSPKQGSQSPVQISKTGSQISVKSGQNVSSIGTATTPNTSKAPLKHVKSKLMEQTTQELKSFQTVLETQSLANKQLNVQIGSNDIKKQIVENLHQIDYWSLGMRKTTDEQSNEISDLHEEALEGCALYEEAKVQQNSRNNSRNQTFNHLRPLDPYSRRKLDEIRKKYHYIRTQVNEVNALLDLENNANNNGDSSELIHRSSLNMRKMRISAESKVKALSNKFKSLSIGSLELNSTLNRDNSVVEKSAADISKILSSRTKTPVRCYSSRKVVDINMLQKSLEGHRLQNPLMALSSFVDQTVPNKTSVLLNGVNNSASSASTNNTVSGAQVPSIAKSTTVQKCLFGTKPTSSSVVPSSTFSNKPMPVQSNAKVGSVGTTTQSIKLGGSSTTPSIAVGSSSTTSTTQSSLFGSITTTSTTQSGLFGSSQSNISFGGSAATSQSNTFGSTAVPTAKTSLFGNLTTTSNQTSTFGNGSTGSSLFGLITTTPSTVAGIESIATTKNSPSSTSTQNSLFKNGSVTITPINTFSSGTTATTQSFNFSSGSTVSTQSFSFNSGATATKSFNFGGISSTPTTTTTTTTTKGFNFSSGPTASTQSGVFGNASSVPTQSSSIGSVATTAVSTQSSSCSSGVSVPTQSSSISNVAATTVSSQSNSSSIGSTTTTQSFNFSSGLGSTTTQGFNFGGISTSTAPSTGFGSNSSAISKGTLFGNDSSVTSKSSLFGSTTTTEGICDSTSSSTIQSCFGTTTKENLFGPATTQSALESITPNNNVIEKAVANVGSSNITTSNKNVQVGGVEKSSTVQKCLFGNKSNSDVQSSTSTSEQVSIQSSIATTSQSSSFGDGKETSTQSTISRTNTTTTQSLFGAITPAMTQSGTFAAGATMQSSVFGSSAVATSKASLFDGSTATITQNNIIVSEDTTTTTTSQNSIFGNETKTTAQSGIVSSATQNSAISSTSNNKSSLFGSGATASTQGSLFGSASTSTKSSVFGTGSTVTTASSVFGSGSVSTSTSSVFGTGSSVISASSGAATTSTSSIFGSGATSTSTSSRFGNGSTATTTSSVSGLTSTSTNSIFGSGSTATSTSSMFGTGSATTSTNSIFGTGSTVTTPSSVFGTGTTSTSSIFGSGSTSTPSSVFGSATTQSSIFGAGSSSTTQSSIFSAGSTSTTQSSIFSAGSTSTTQSSIFGAGSTSTTQSSIFGGGSSTTSQGSTFGTGASTTVTTQSSIFGSVTAPTVQNSVFGNTSSTTSQNSLFGNNATSNSSIFGNSTGTTQGSVFGSTPVSTSQSGFGSTNQSIFGKETTQSTFGSSSQNTFGNSGSIFGGSASTKPSLFGGSTTLSQGSTFGTQESKPAFGGNSVFGTSSFNQNSTFGSSNNAASGDFANQASSEMMSFGLGQSPNKEKANQNAFGSVKANSTPTTDLFKEGGSQSAFGEPSFQNNSSSSSFNAPPFGGTATFGGGASFGGAPKLGSSIFGGQSAFGASGTSAFGGSPSSGNTFGAFGGASTGASTFGNVASSGGSTFGNASTGGGSTFGNASSGESTFGSLVNNSGGNSFGGIQSSGSSFGGISEQSGGGFSKQMSGGSFSTWRK